MRDEFLTRLQENLNDAKKKSKKAKTKKEHNKQKARYYQILGIQKYLWARKAFKEDHDRREREIALLKELIELEKQGDKRRFKSRYKHLRQYLVKENHIVNESLTISNFYSKRKLKICNEHISKLFTPLVQFGCLKQEHERFDGPVREDSQYHLFKKQYESEKSYSYKRLQETKQDLIDAWVLLNGETEVEKFKEKLG